MLFETESEKWNTVNVTKAGASNNLFIISFFLIFGSYLFELYPVWPRQFFERLEISACLK